MCIKFFVYRKSSQLGIGDEKRMGEICSIGFNGQTMKLIQRYLSRDDLFGINEKNQASVHIIYLIAFERDYGSSLSEGFWCCIEIVIPIIPELVDISKEFFFFFLHCLTNKKWVKFFSGKNPNIVRINFSNEW